MQFLIVPVRPEIGTQPSRPEEIQMWTHKRNTARCATVRPMMYTRLRASRFVLAAIIGGLAVAAGACSSDDDAEGSPLGPDPPAASGSIEVTVATIGDELDPDGYALAVDGGVGQATELDQELTLTGLTAGAHTLELTGVAANCRVTNVENPLFLLVPDGGAAQVSYLVFCLPPDAGRIFFLAGASSIQSMAAIGGDQTVIGPTLVSGFSVSRGGDRIVYTSQRDRLFVQDADGSNNTLVTEEGEIGPSLDLSPDGTRIVFTQGGRDLFVINVDGSGLTNLTNGNLGPDNRDPAWSPSGDRIVFSASDIWGSLFGSPDASSPLYVMNSDGSGVQPLTNPADGIHHSNPDWSPDGDEIAFSVSEVSDASGTTITISASGFFVVNADGSGLMQLTPDINESSHPSWSPDGRWIAFSSGGINSSAGIFVMRADGSDVVQLTFRGEGAPQWR